MSSAPLRQLACAEVLPPRSLPRRRNHVADGAHAQRLVEVAIVGRQGFVEISVALGTMVSLHRTLVTIPCEALRIKKDS
jgi:hypothetical protein